MENTKYPFPVIAIREKTNLYYSFFTFHFSFTFPSPLI